MQLVESDGDQLRVAELRLRRRGSPLEFLLFPMIHIGSPEFYAEVDRRLAAVDLIVAEGVGPSRTTDVLTSTYRSLVGGRSGLVVQGRPGAGSGVPVINPDSGGAEFEERWRTVPAWQRGVTWVGARSLTAAVRVFGPDAVLPFVLRELQDWSLDDLPTNEEVLDESFADVGRVVLDERDDRLMGALHQIVETRSRDTATVAVVYGADHLRAVTRELSRCYRYRVRAGEWLTVLRF
jgi:hypothetical protein